MERAMDLLLNLHTSGLNSAKPASTRADTLAIMQHYLTRLDLDITPLRVIHIAGTKGKGSTCCMTESCCRAAGYTTGLFTSPHLISATERFRLAGQPISETLFLKHFYHVYNTLHATQDASVGTLFPPMAGFFRFLTLMAFHLFLSEGVDVVILEVGLGGRLDATNVVLHPIVCGITTLDLDHTHILGSTLDLIAAEKAGIFKPGIPAYTVDQDPVALNTLYAVAEATTTSLSLVPEWKTLKGVFPAYQLALRGAHQHSNAALAVTLASVFHHSQQPPSQSPPSPQSSPFPQVTPAYQHALATCEWPGRCQVVHDPLEATTHWYLDGAHTAKSIRCCLDWFQTDRRVTTPRALLFFCSHDRDVLSVLAPLVASGPFAHVIFCRIEATRPSTLTKPTAASLLSAAGIPLPLLLTDRVASDDDDLESCMGWQTVLKEVWMGFTKQASACPNNLIAMPRTTPIILPSIAESVQYLRAATRSSMKTTIENAEASLVGYDVLVTGSLYLVGGVLSALNHGNSVASM